MEQNDQLPFSLKNLQDLLNAVSCRDWSPNFIVVLHTFWWVPYFFVCSCILGSLIASFWPDKLNEKAMSISLPQPIEDYFNADADGVDTVGQCFTENAVVRDEGRTYIGAAAIRHWKAGVSEKYVYTSTPFACTDADGSYLVMSHVNGNFPGSPVDLRYVFRLEGDKINYLEITP